MADEKRAEWFQWETVDLTVRLVDEEWEPAPEALEGVQDMVFTVAQGNKKLNVFLNEMVVDYTEGTVTIHFSQTMSGSLNPGHADVELNVLYEDGERDASYWGEVFINENLFKKVM